MPRGARLVAAPLLLILAVLAWWMHQRTTLFDRLIADAASHNGLDFHLVKALIYEESWFRPRIRGSAGELGLMQVSMAVANDFAARRGFPPITPARLLEPDLNLEIGSWYLKQSLERYRHSPAPLVFALVRYNAGEVRADTWLQLAKSKPVPPGTSAEEHCLSLVEFPKTRDYARRILQRFRSRSFWF